MHTGLAPRRTVLEATTTPRINQNKILSASWTPFLSFSRDFFTQSRKFREKRTAYIAPAPDRFAGSESRCGGNTVRGLNLSVSLTRLGWNTGTYSI